MEKFHKLLENKAKSQKPMSSPEKDAKLRAIQEMRKMASDEMAVPLHGLKKVTVASNNPEGIKEGLDKAKELMDHPHDSEPMEHDEIGDDESEESPEEEQSEEVPDEKDADDMSPEELQMKIAELQKILAMKK